MKMNNLLTSRRCLRECDPQAILLSEFRPRFAAQQAVHKRPKNIDWCFLNRRRFASRWLMGNICVRRNTVVVAGKIHGWSGLNHSLCCEMSCKWPIHKEWCEGSSAMRGSLQRNEGPRGRGDDEEWQGPERCVTYEYFVVFEDSL